ncbi:MAG: hypothetical protein SNJ84_02350 [Verrucomicrobiia bacterium]
MEPSPAPDTPGLITLRFSRRSLFLAAALLLLVVTPLLFGTVAIGGYLLWSHLDHQSRLNQATAAHAQAFSAEARSFESLLSAAELQQRDLQTALTQATSASRPNTIPVERLTAETDTLRASATRLSRGPADLAALESNLREQFRLKPADRLISPAHETQLRLLNDRVSRLVADTDRLPAQLALAVARRDELVAQAAAAQRAAAQRRAAQQRAAAQRATPVAEVPRATVVREVIVARPAPVFSVGFGTFGPAYYPRHYYRPRPVWYHPGYRYSPCPRTGTRVGVGVAFNVR